ncbi:MAG: glycosyltransferase [Saprospiraceae bacterium]
MEHSHTIETSQLTVQVVSFDWPWPANYGGVVDIYYRIESLLELGVGVDLHVVSQHQQPGPIPENWVNKRFKLFTFPRRGWSSALSPKPYIVSSRAVPSLLPKLASGPPIILFEGIHTTAFLGHPRLNNHAQWVRVHNREAAYYQELSETTDSTFGKFYYREEARRLKSYEPRVLAEADLLLPASQRDAAYCESLAPGRVLVHRSSTSLKDVEIKKGRGGFVLFHAGLHVHDNAISAVELAKRMSARPNIKFVIAGKDPSDQLRTTLSSIQNVELIANPSMETMHGLIADAQIILLHANHQAGFKVKLLESLARGRWVLTNTKMVHGAPGLKAGTSVVDDSKEWIEEVDKLWTLPFLDKDENARVALLKGYLRGDLATAFLDKLKEVTFNRN